MGLSLEVNSLGPGNNRHNRCHSVLWADLTVCNTVGSVIRTVSKHYISFPVEFTKVGLVY